MVNRMWRPVVMIVGSVVLLSGCAATVDTVAPLSAVSESDTPASPASQGPASHEGASHEGASDEAAGAEPSAAARMICAPETVDAVTVILGLETAPHTVDSWDDSLYTCTYHLPTGALELSVKESADEDGAKEYFDASASKIDSATPIEGLANLGFPAYETSDGSAVFLKDNMTLTVDASGLPEKNGPHDVTRNALAYQVATTILACWTAHH